MRPAYVLEAVQDGESIELMHVYIPMGIERQYEKQSCIFGRFRCHELAVCFLVAAKKYLSMGYSSHACKCVVPDEARKNGTPADIMAKWEDLVQQRQLRDAYSLDLNLIVSPTVYGWKETRKVIELYVGKIFLESLGIIAEPMQRTNASEAPSVPCTAVAPALRYTFESSGASMRPPVLLGGELCLWPGRMYAGSIAAVLSSSWMNWCRVSHVLCVIGKYDRLGNETKEYHAVLDARLPGVCYFFVSSQQQRFPEALPGSIQCDGSCVDFESRLPAYTLQEW